MRAIHLSPFIKDILLTTMTAVITTLAALVVTRMLAMGLGPEKFGAYALSRRLLATVAPFVMLGMDLAITRYVAIAPNHQARNSYFLSGLWLGVILGFVLLVIGLVFRDSLSFLIYQNEAYPWLFVATLVLVVGYSFYIMLYAFYRGSRRMSRANLWQINVVGFGPVIVAGILANSGWVEAIIFGQAILFLSATVPLAYYVYIFWHDRPTLALSFSARELLEYGLPRVPAGLALAGILATGPFLAPHIGDLKDAGYLAAGQSVLTMIEGAIVAFGLVALPKVAQLAAAGQREFLKNSISDLIAFILHLGLFINLHTLLWADQIVLILLGPQYEAALPVMRIILLGLVPYLAYVLLRSVVDAVEKKAINAMNLWISFIITLASNLFLVSLGFGIRGLAMGTALGFLSVGFLTIRYLWTTYQLDRSSLRLNEGLLFNAGFITLAILLKQGLLQLSGSPLLIAAAICVEAGLFALFMLALWKTKVHWLIELEKRIIKKPVRV